METVFRVNASDLGDDGLLLEMVACDLVRQTHDVVARELVRLKDEAIHQALVARGWTPPQEEAEPVQYLQEPDWDAVRNAVEKVIRRHEIELKVEARRKVEAQEAREKEASQKAFKVFMDKELERRRGREERLNGMRNMFGGCPIGMQGAGIGGPHGLAAQMAMAQPPKLFGSWAPLQIADTTVAGKGGRQRVDSISLCRPSLYVGNS